MAWFDGEEGKPKSGDTLLEPAGYIEHLAGVWEIAQRTIKGQMNE